MANYAIWVVSPNGYIHNQSFYDVAVPLRDAVKECGHECEVVSSLFYAKSDAKVIVLAGHLLAPYDIVPGDAIIYNMEQVGSDWVGGKYLELLKKHRVWDYSAVNSAELGKLGVNAELVEVGYMPCMTDIEPQEETGGILFYGSVNPRRANILERLGSNAKTLFGVYGKERDAAIAKSKIVLNMNYYPAKIFNITRVARLLANRKCVVSETGVDKAMEYPLAEGIVWSDYERLVPTCLHLLQDDEVRRHVANRGFEVFSQRRYTDFVRGKL